MNELRILQRIWPSATFGPPNPDGSIPMYNKAGQLVATVTGVDARRIGGCRTEPPARTRVVHVNDNVPGAVYIGRANRWKGLKGSQWQNPYPVKTFGRAKAIELYRRHMDNMLFSDRKAWTAKLHELVGKPLACWCRHNGEARTDDNACHGDVLVALIEELGLEQDGDA